MQLQDGTARTYEDRDKCGDGLDRGLALADCGKIIHASEIQVLSADIGKAALSCNSLGSTAIPALTLNTYQSEFG